MTQAPPVNRMIVAVAALIGLFVAFYLAAHSFGWTGPLVCGVGDCGTVQASPYAMWGPVPVSVVGLAGYAALLALALAGLQPRLQGARVVSFGLVAGATFGFGASVWFTYAEAFLIHAWCQWCVISALLMTVIFFSSLPELRRLRGSRSGDGTDREEPLE